MDSRPGPNVTNVGDRELDSSKRVYPNFFIVGAAKSGTTSMWRYLKQHPEVFMPDGKIKKEPAYFSELAGYESQDRYYSLFENAQEQHVAVGEASTAYLSDPSSPERIAAEIPDARIIIMLRNPVDRAYSLYNWMTQEGYEYASSFEHALELEEKRVEDEHFKHENPQYYYNYLYFRSGLYSEQVKRYSDKFDEEDILVLIFEEFVLDTASAYRGACRFLGVDPSFTPDLKVHNESRDVFYPPLQYLIRRLSGLFNRLAGRTTVEKDRRDALLNVGLSAQPPPDLQTSLRAELREAYRNDVQRLESLIGRDLGLWYDTGE
jgi:hypothetical protein